MLHFVSILAAMLCLSPAWSQSFQDKSARREPGVSYQAYKSRMTIFNLGRAASPFTSRSAVDSAVRFGDGNLPKATAWTSEKEMLQRFRQFRDVRFLSDRAHPNFPRRSTWLYPDDGCFARAALVNRNLTRLSVTVPSKVFVFGDLNVHTPNAPGGEVTWWYHVAPLVEVGDRKFVLDPAIEPRFPLPLEEWLAKMSGTPQNLEVAVCGSGSYTPYDSCEKVTDGLENEAESDQMGYLGPEWSRLESLNRDPRRELGDNPPWN